MIQNSLKYKDEQTFKYLLKVTLYEYLAPKRCLYEYNIGKKEFDIIMKEMMKWHLLNQWLNQVKWLV